MFGTVIAINQAYDDPGFFSHELGVLPPSWIL